jgi:hypothetical protein
MTWLTESKVPWLRRRGSGFVALLCSTSLTLSPALASAVGNEETNSIGKGIVGGALVGGELVMAVEALVGVEPWWGYAIGGGAGAIGGGIGGFFLADAGTGAAPMALLTAGLILAIPTTIAVMSATSYHGDPETDTARLKLQRPVLPPAFVGYDPAVGMRLGVPAVSVSDVYSPKLRMAYGLPNEQEVRVPMLDVHF